MCEIQFIYNRKRNLNNFDISVFTNMLRFGSMGNPDAFGLFNSKKKFRHHKLRKMNNLNTDLLNKDNFVIGHNRYKTQGDERDNKNNHPFKIGSFIVVHNGVLQNDDELKEKYKYEGGVETDSVIIPYLINKFYEESKQKNKEKRELKAIKKTAELLEGSFSIFVYNEITKNIYYFKNDKTYFYFFIIDNEYLMGSTSSIKFNYLFEYLKKKYLKIEDNHIYRVNDKTYIKDCGEFKDNSITYFNQMETETEEIYGYSEENDFKDFKEFEGNILNGLTGDDLIYYIDDYLREYLGFVPCYKVEQQQIIFTKKAEFKDLQTCFNCFKYEGKLHLSFRSLQET